MTDYWKGEVYAPTFSDDGVLVHAVSARGKKITVMLPMQELIKICNYINNKH